MNNVWLAIYTHRFGNDYVLFKHEPTHEEMAAHFTNYEPERDLDAADGPQDEYLSCEQIYFAIAK